MLALLNISNCALISERLSPEMVRAGERHASVEGLFTLGAHPQVEAMLEEAGVAARASGEVELVVRRALSAEGRSRVFVNNRLATLSLLRSLRPMPVYVHETHLELLDAFAELGAERE